MRNIFKAFFLLVETETIPITSLYNSINQVQFQLLTITRTLFNLKKNYSTSYKIYYFFLLLKKKNFLLRQFKWKKRGKSDILKLRS